MEFGPYRIQGLLGQGGMGVVHRAYDTVHERVVALKRLPRNVTDREYRLRFQREARLAAGLSHPHVIPVNDFGEIDGNLFLDMLLVDGTDLRRTLGAGSLDQDRIIDLLAQIASALDAAHAKGLVHRDVKPSNILIDNTGHAYLADFGIARETSADATVLTQSGELIGTWDYMAPERMSAGLVDGRSDQYSLACVLFECLTGRLAHPASDPAAKVAAHLLQPPPAPSLFVPTITPGLDAVVMRGMSKDPGRRFATATEMMAAAKESAYAGDTVRAARPTAPDQGILVRAIVRSTAPRKRPTLQMPHDYPPTCPYPGLIGFERSDADVFHGRDHVVTDLLVRLAEQLDGGEPVVLVGASGAGKSSVLHAGLLPTLAAADQEWPQILLTPGPDPVGLLAEAMAPHVGMSPAEVAREIRTAPTAFGSLCAKTRRVVIVVDQFEELFTHDVPESDRLAFSAALAHARPALVVLAVRADLVDRCIELTPLLPALTSPVLLGSMDATELRQAIVRPARDSGIDIEPGLPERLIADLGVRGEKGYDPGALPRLAHALREAWNFREGTVLTLAAYRRAGGIDGAVSRTAEQIFNGLDPWGRHTLRAILLRLVTVFDDGTVARRRVDPRELAGPIMDSLIAARLVTVDSTGARLSHEALLTAWPRLRDWIDEDRAGLIQHRRFTDAVRVWLDSGQQADDLYRGVRLTTLNTWLESARTRLQPAESEFLARSNAAEHAGQIAARRRTRRLRGMVAALSVLLVVAAIASIVATQLQQDAQDERARADTSAQMSLSRQLAAEAALSRGVDPHRSALAALGAWQAGQSVEARSALLSAQTDFYRGTMTGHKGAVTALAVSADGSVAASGGRDGTLRLWDVPNRRQLAILDDTGGWYRTLAMSTNGRILAVASLDKANVTVWNVPERKRIFTVPVRALDVALTPDGSKLAARGERGVVVYETGKFTELISFQGAISLATAMSADGSLVATTDGPKVLVNRVSDGALVATLTGHTAGVTGLAFSRNGAVLASSGSDSAVRLWDTATWAAGKVLSSSEGPVSAVVIDPQSATVIAGGVGTTLYAWDLASGELLIRLSTGSVTTLGLAITGDGHTLLGSNSEGVLTRWNFGRSMLGTRETSFVGVAYQPNGRLLAGVGAYGVVQVWDAATGDLVHRLTGPPDTQAYEAAFSPDGSQLAVSGAGVLIVWDTVTGKEIGRFQRPGTQLIAVSYSPDGKTIALAGRTPAETEEDHDEILLLRADDRTLADRRPTRGEERNPQSNAVDSNYPTSVSYSPDGRTLAISLSAGKVALWHLVDPGADMTFLRGHEGIANDVEFSPDGTMLASGGVDRVVRLWRANDGQQAGELTGFDSTVRKVSFSPDGRMLAVAGQDTVVRLWDVAGRQPLARLDRHSDDLNEVVFDAAGEHIASASADGTVRIWDLVPQHAIDVVCGLLDHDTLADQWRAVGPDRGAAPSCAK
ncbi:MAG: protein kinase [Kibdelosporangium sp.]